MIIKYMQLLNINNIVFKNISLYIVVIHVINQILIEVRYTLNIEPILMESN